MTPYKWNSAQIKIKTVICLMEFPVSNCPPNGSGSSLSLASVPVECRARTLY